MTVPTYQARPEVLVIGGGLAGLAAALDCADRGAQVTLIERRNRLGGLTWSFRHADHWVDNGQHVFLRCCEEYLSFLDRIGAASDVELPDGLDIPVVAPSAGPGQAPRFGRLRRNNLPAPLHLLGSLLHFPHLSVSDRLGLGRAVLGLRRLDLADEALDNESFESWLLRHGQSPGAVAAVWDLITVPTVNLPARQASLAMAAKVFKTGLLTKTRAADIGWSRVPLGQLHGERAGAALQNAGVDVRLRVRAQRVEPAPEVGRADRPTTDRSVVGTDDGRAPRFVVRTDSGDIAADAVIVAVPHDTAGDLLPPAAVAHQDRLRDLGMSAIVDVHLIFDRPVTRWPLLAALDSPVQWVFDRTASSGLPGGPGGPQYVAVSVSAADDLVTRRPDELVPWITAELGRLLPETAGAHLVDAVVTKERNATFRAQPGTAVLRPGPATEWPGLAVAGAWTDTGWPATMEGAVKSGRAAAAVALDRAGIRARPARSPRPTNTEEVA